MKSMAAKLLFMGGILVLLAGCGASQPGTEGAPDETAPPDIRQEETGASEGSVTIAPEAGVQPKTDGQYIGDEAAKQIALSHAGVSGDEARFAHAHLELDDGRWEYEVAFLEGSTEYEYCVDALTGEILSFDQDEEYSRHISEGIAGSELITREQAAQLALEYAGVPEEDAQLLELELDYEDGRAVYEVDWYVGQAEALSDWYVGTIEYSCEVDAATGEILSLEKELDSWD